MSVREDRLRAENAAMRKWRSDVVKWKSVSKTEPPDKYEITYSLKSIVGFDANKKPIYHTGFKVVVEFPPDYPRAKPEVFLSPDSKPWPWHPNIWTDGRFCLEGTQHWIPGLGAPLDSICQMIGEMLAFQEVYIKSPANGDKFLLDWVEKNFKLEEGTLNRVRNPVDTSTIRLPDIEDTIRWGTEKNEKGSGKIIFG
jgi:ubiquitin-protein ligase